MICHYYSEPLFLLYVPELPGLLYYSHVPAIVISLLVGTFVIWNNRKELLNRLLFAICIFFSLWTLLNLISWTNIHSDILLFSWSFFGPLSALISIFSVYFTYVFLQKQDVTPWTKIGFLALLVPVVLLAPTNHSLRGFNIDNCDAFGFEGVLYEMYYYSLGALAMAWILALLVKHYRKAAPGMRSQIVLMGTGIELFLFSFFTTGYLASYLTSIGLLPDSQIEMYGFFGMVIFMVYISILIVRFRTFHVGLIASQALVIALILLIGSQFTFIRNSTNLILTSITLVLTGVVGIILIRSVKREVEQRKHIEELAHDLEKANEQQVVLIHFITHQIKGFVTKSRNIFSMALEGDFGPVPEQLKPMLEEGFRSDTKGVETIQGILTAANIKSGKVTFTMMPCDLKATIDDIARDLKPNADAKGVALNVDTGTEPMTFNGDCKQLVNAFKNLIDNSIKYTPKGSVNVKLTKDSEVIRFTIEDTGVGITPEDMKVLFTEGGHGKESVKVNVESTGFGLFIVKNIIEAHKGKVWAESEGAGKGSRFVVELPA